MAWITLALVIGAIWLARRQGRLERRLAALERELAALRSERDAGAAAPGVERPEPVAPPTPREVGPRAPALPPTAPSQAAPSGRGSATPPGRPSDPLAALRSLPEIDWERWLGVRGAAVLGGVVLALAGLFFFRYSIEHELIPPWLRVAIGGTVGLVCLAGSEWRLRRRYAALADALAGAGMVILYATSWAACVRYALVGPGLAFAGMVATTAAGSALSWRHASLVIAALGLAGGFATPLLLASPVDDPIGLFAYLLLLDAALLVLALRRGWPWLGVASLLATTGYQLAWMGWEMGPERLPLGLAILGVFALVFAAGGRALPAGPRGETRLVQAGGVLFPFGFALYFGAGLRFTPHLWPVAALLALLVLAAGWLAREREEPWLAAAAAAGGVAVSAAWLWTHALDARLAWELAGVAFALALASHLFVELPGRDARAASAAAQIAAFGQGLLLVVAPEQQPAVPLWPWLVGWLALAALLVRHAGRLAIGWLAPAAAFGVALGLARFATTGGTTTSPEAVVAASLAVAVGWQLVALLHADGALRRWSEHAAALFPLVVALALGGAPFVERLGGERVLGASLVLGVLAGLSALRSGLGGWALAATATTAVVHGAWTFSAGRAAAGGETLAALVVAAAAAVLFTALPFADGTRLLRDRFASRASALAGPLWFPTLYALFERRFGDDAIGAVPVALAALSGGAAWLARRALADAPEARRRALVWHLGAALGFAAAAVPAQLEHEWITVAWALEGLALVWLWRRLDHPGLKWTAAALLAAATVRLVANPALLGYHPRGAWPVLNWVLYTYWVPAAALVAASSWLAPLELPRMRPFERRLYARGWPLVAVGAGVAALGVVFVWINLAVIDLFAEGPVLRLPVDRAPARDLTLSIAWALYGLALLALGVRRASRALRWASLVLVMITVAKVFLHDLGQLRDLYRVASLLGLALSLITVSLAYQRFVLRRTPGDER